jgi:hypothetical protein
MISFFANFLRGIEDTIDNIMTELDRKEVKLVCMVT